MSTEDVKKKRIRSGYRGSTTRLLSEVDTALEATPLDCDKLSQLKMCLNEKLQTLKQLDAEIVELVDEAELEAEIDGADRYKKNVFSALTRIDKALRRNGTPPPAAAPPTTTTPPPVSHKVKLPKIALPKFGGNLLKWSAFWDSFESAVHTNRSISNVEKFNYLRSSLERTAYDAIAGLALSGANYEEAVEILEKRFGDQELIVSKHMETLLGVEPVPASDKNSRSLRRLYDEVESHIRSLKALGVEHTSYGAMLAPVLLTKLPPDVRLIVSRKVGTGAKIDQILKHVEEELTARERTAYDPTPPPTRQQDKNKRTNVFNNSSNPKPPSCCFCQQGHSSKDCTTIVTTAARKASLKNDGRCYNCLARGHLSRQCRSAGRCSKCKGKHHTSICDVQDQTPPSTSQSLSQTTTLNPEAPSFATTANNFCASSVKSVLLQTARAQIYNTTAPHHSVEIRLLLDSGSQRSYLSERARRVLGLKPVGEQQLAIATFGSSREQVQAYPIVEVGMGLKGCAPVHLSLYVVPMICEPLISQPIAACVSECPHLASLELADSADKDSSLEVDVLIGSDYYWTLVTGGVSRGAQGPVAIHTRLGWVLSGPASAAGTTRSTSTNLATTHVLSALDHDSDDGLVEQLRAFWDLESLGIVGTERTLYDDFVDAVTIHNGRYEVSLPWKEAHRPLPDNYKLSLKRLRGLLHRLRQNPEILKLYDSIIRDQIEKGIVEPDPDPSNGTAENLCHYLPHHAVMRNDKVTTKLRVVYDASAKVAGGPSLNDCLHKGPKFNQLILDILLRFRVFKYALTADLEKAFLQVSVVQDDCDVLRFLWVNDIHEDPPNIRALRFTRVVFGVSASPFLLNATLKYHLEKYATTHPEVVGRLLESTYVDDIVSGAQSKDEAFELYAQAKSIFWDGAFNLRKFVSNSASLQQRIDLAEQEFTSGPPRLPADDHALDESFVGATLGDSQPLGMKEQKVLGVRWKPADDRLLFDVSDVAQLAITLEPTKCNVISIVGRFYDPLGFLTPLTVRFKIFFQKLCDSKIGWDEPLSDEVAADWKVLVEDLCAGTGTLSIPRGYFSDSEGVVTSHCLYGFCDASTRAYAAVIYLVTVTGDSTSVSFVAAKTRVAPLQPQTIPRLELLSALLLSRLMSTVANSLTSNLPQLELRCFTDSQIALYWIQGVDKEWRPFVRNRVLEIRQTISPGQWNHCPGETNPADLPSRGLSLMELSASKLWRCGPDWLPTAIRTTEDLAMPDECALEMKTKTSTFLAADGRPLIDEVMDCKRYSSLSRLARVTAYVLRAVQLFKGNRPSQSELTAAELMEAERLWLHSAQKLLLNDKHFELWQKQFKLFKDEQGLWRCGGRLENANIPYATKHPILLPRNHHFTVLVFRDAHIKVAHDGVKETLTEIRRKFWIVKGRTCVRALLHRCVLCRRFEGAAYRPPPPPPLPAFRVQEQPPFTYTGVDYAGPLHVRTYGQTETDKAWICLFTCLVTRAVHLEVVTDMLTETFIRALKRFSARRGVPRKFLSDNGKTFKAAARFLDAVFKEDIVQGHLSGRGVEWIFNLEKAPWWGGSFERMVKSTKRCLRKMVGRAKFTLDELNTALTEVESILNSRPLSYISSSDLEEPLTPSHLLMGRRVLNMPDQLGVQRDDPDDEDFTVGPDTLSDRVKRLNAALNHFWDRWRDEYLIELRETHRHADHSRAPSTVSVGDIVIIHDEGLPRGFWKLGKVEKLIAGRDSAVRGAVLRLSSGTGTLQRPIQLLYPLEVREVPVPGTTSSGEDVPNVPDDDPPNVPDDDPPNVPDDDAPDVPGDDVPDVDEGNPPASSARPQRASAFRARDRLMATALADGSG